MSELPYRNHLPPSWNRHKSTVIIVTDPMFRQEKRDHFLANFQTAFGQIAIPTNNRNPKAHASFQLGVTLETAIGNESNDSLTLIQGTLRRLFAGTASRFCFAARQPEFAAIAIRAASSGSLATRGIGAANTTHQTARFRAASGQIAATARFAAGQAQTAAIAIRAASGGATAAR
ncbi:hypothetical protein [Tuwongella immobilis]|uniref:Uncharacterized protein n=1 Tax=Tuwongella immobilis TaxID=692036 RepID=A0A6C2YMY1_9BACT|nr:hypothetical protein [Tuwongella immobilis]VIP02641.1 unnamed protein product [Tuwongella immobilis]VTS02011.1 unnamed protein product [Tuwongella immobilis]